MPSPSHSSSSHHTNSRPGIDPIPGYSLSSSRSSLSSSLRSLPAEHEDPWASAGVMATSLKSGGGRSGGSGSGSSEGGDRIANGKGVAATNGTLTTPVKRNRAGSNTNNIYPPSTDKRTSSIQRNSLSESIHSHSSSTSTSGTFPSHPLTGAAIPSTGRRTSVYAGEYGSPSPSPFGSVGTGRWKGKSKAEQEQEEGTFLDQDEDEDEDGDRFPLTSNLSHNLKQGKQNGNGNETDTTTLTTILSRKKRWSGGIKGLGGSSGGGGKGLGGAGEVDLARELAVWAKVVEGSAGRDKMLKCIQYSTRTYLYLISLLLSLSSSTSRLRLIFDFLILRLRLKSGSRRAVVRGQALGVGEGKERVKKEMEHVKKLNGLVSGLSLARKCLTLFNPLLPLSHLLSPSPLTGSQFFLHILTFCNGMADDVYCLSKLGVVGVRRGKWAQKWANRFWLLATLIALSKMHLLPSSQLPLFPSPRSPATLASYALEDDPLRKKKEKELMEAEWTARKLWCDFVFASYDVFSWTFLKEPIQCVLGLTAGLISTSKLYDKQAALIPRY